MRIRRLALPTALFALLATSPAAWAAVSQQAAKDRFAADAQGEQFVSSPMTAGASTVVGTVSAQRLGVAAAAGPGAVARAAVNRYQALLGLTDARTQLRYAGASTDDLGRSHVQFEQVVGAV
ncbi:MAG: hypothetical protein QOG35_992, partial [Solirubrobacteraceae bacterium]|nr:hypothetical protein [Solirubrobacteraceae bacterium]